MKCRKYICVIFISVFFIGLSSFTPCIYFTNGTSSDSLLLVKTNEGCEMIIHNYYKLCYSEKHEQAIWLSYFLTKSMSETNNAKRKNNFYPDALVSGGSAFPVDYKNSGYDRGHLCPAGDMNFSELAMNESFYMSNISPQVPAFNRGMWSMLEEKIRQWAVADSQLYIITGGLLHDSLPVIGITNKISVPEYFYKVVLDNEGAEKKAIAFIMPNKKLTGSVFNYAVTVDSLEKLSGLDFFYHMNVQQQHDLETHVDSLLWK